MLAVVSNLVGLASALDAPSGRPRSKQSASATLQISVNVIPVVQTATITAQSRQSGAIVYTLENALREERYEVRDFCPESVAPDKVRHPAILKTLVLVPQ